MIDAGVAEDGTAGGGTAGGGATGDGAREGAGEPPGAPAQASPDPDAPPPLSCEATIRNQRGLHARAAAKFVKLAETFSACITVQKGGTAVSGRSIMGLMMLGAGQGSQVTLEAEGWDAREALDALAGLIEAGFHED